MNRGEVWWVDFDPAVGSEVIKIRPAVVVSNEGTNLRIGRALVVPLTSSVDTVHRSETLVRFRENDSKAMIDQMRVADNYRFRNYIETLSQDDVAKVMDIIKSYLDID